MFGDYLFKCMKILKNLWIIKQKGIHLKCDVSNQFHRLDFSNQERTHAKKSLKFKPLLLQELEAHFKFKKKKS